MVEIQSASVMNIDAMYILTNLLQTHQAFTFEAFDPSIDELYHYIKNYNQQGDFPPDQSEQTAKIRQHHIQSKFDQLETKILNYKSPAILRQIQELNTPTETRSRSRVHLRLHDNDTTADILNNVMDVEDESGPEVIQRYEYCRDLLLRIPQAQQQHADQVLTSHSQPLQTRIRDLLNELRSTQILERPRRTPTMEAVRRDMPRIQTLETSAMSSAESEMENDVDDDDFDFDELTERLMQMAPNSEYPTVRTEDIDALFATLPGPYADE
jgi:hypothetical protein